MDSGEHGTPHCTRAYDARAGGCSAATTPRTTAPRAACPRKCARRSTRSTATCARADEIVDGPAPRPPTPAQRRAALDAWEARARARAGRRALAITRSSPRWSTPAARHELPLDELDAYMGSMRVDCGPRAHRHRATSSTLHGRLAPAAVGRIMAAAARRARAPARRRRAAWASPSSSTNFIRDVREDCALDRIYLPGDRARGAISRDAPSRASTRAARAASPTRSRRARDAVRRRPPASPRRSRRACAPACAWRARVYAARAGPRRGATATTSLGGARRCRRGSLGAARARCGGARDDPPRDRARRRAHVAGRRRAPTC